MGFQFFTLLVLIIVCFLQDVLVGSELCPILMTYFFLIANHIEYLFRLGFVYVYRYFDERSSCAFDHILISVL